MTVSPALDRAAKLPRLLLGTLPTPLVEASRLTHALGGPPIYVKRDDLAGFGLVGHKARQLEFLVGAALDQDCDVMVTGGGPSSNFCAAVASAASAAGLDCHLVLSGAEPVDEQAQTHPNLAVAQACGAVVRYTRDANRSSVDARVAEVAEALKAGGRRPFAMPRGGATGLGTVGMVLGVEELAAQLDEAGIEPDMIVVATGSGSTGRRAGLGCITVRTVVAGGRGFGQPPAGGNRQPGADAGRRVLRTAGRGPARRPWPRAGRRPGARIRSGIGRR